MEMTAWTEQIRKPKHEAMAQLAIALDQRRKGEPTEFSEEFIQGIIFGTNIKLDEAMLLLQSKFPHNDETFLMVKKILTNLKIE
jgi:hypothetical protein